MTTRPLTLQVSNTIHTVSTTAANGTRRDRRTSVEQCGGLGRSASTGRASRRRSCPGRAMSRRRRRTPRTARQPAPVRPVIEGQRRPRARCRNRRVRRQAARCTGPSGRRRAVARDSVFWERSRRFSKTCRGARRATTRSRGRPGRCVSASGRRAPSQPELHGTLSLTGGRRPLRSRGRTVPLSGRSGTPRSPWTRRPLHDPQPTWPHPT